MALDVIDLRQFYASPLGDFARRSVLSAITARWPSLSGFSVAGIGYATPYLDHLQKDAERTIALMPGRQGITAWPPGGLSAAGLVDPFDLPLRDAVIDRLLVVHALEVSEDAQGMMEELWRILAPGGHMIVVAPNRRGAWARRDSTPFGYGQPYSRQQLTTLMRQSLFTPLNWTEALHSPPLQSQWMLKLAPAFERVGTALSLPFAGVHVIEATKQLYRPVLARRAQRASTRLMPALVPTAREAD